ncbi:hypothetical protein BUALT_Bualt01G0218200 [Buddleja alternifolia]|uniref:Peroxisomal membrane protein PEX16 n=1 Tax=Buddleja alternifolia TaxID=168488 RepID=A0AAV6YEY1_9LAMI|nr:hypothetical protein BUALT_Bualt01G0218200 [Buddleja alternifolia]
METLIEVVAQQLYGEEKKWNFIAITEAIKQRLDGTHKLLKRVPLIGLLTGHAVVIGAAEFAENFLPLLGSIFDLSSFKSKLITLEMQALKQKITGMKGGLGQFAATTEDDDGL